MASKFKWRYYWLVLFVYHFFSEPHGLVGIITTLQETPLTFFLIPLLPLLFIRLLIFIGDKINQRKLKRKNEK